MTPEKKPGDNNEMKDRFKKAMNKSYSDPESEDPEADEAPDEAKPKYADLLSKIDELKALCQKLADEESGE